MKMLLPTTAVVALAAVSLTACATPGSAATEPLKVSGEIFFLERIALPPGATLRVTAQDVARADAPATMLAQQEGPAINGPPFSFALAIPQDKITPQSRVAVRAQIMSGGKLIFTSTEQHTVATDGTQGPMRIRVSIVPG